MKNPVPVPFFVPYGAKYRELRKENIDMSNIQPIFMQAIRKPERLCIIKRGQHAEGLFPLLRGSQLRCVGHPHEHEIALRRACFHVVARKV